MNLLALKNLLDNGIRIALYYDFTPLFKPGSCWPIKVLHISSLNVEGRDAFFAVA